MRARIGTLSRRLAKAEAGALDNEGKLRSGVMLVPAIMYGNLDAWEQLAMRMQTELRISSAEDLDRKHANDPSQFQHAMPAPVVAGQRTHTPDPHRRQDAPPLPAKRPPLPPSTGMIR